MILVHCRHSWPRVGVGPDAWSPEDATLGEWYKISDAALAEFGDTLLGIYENTVVSAFDITGAERDKNGFVTFQGAPSTTWAHLIGTPNPGKPWGVRGKARPVAYLDTAALTGATVPVHDDGTTRRAVLAGFTLAIDHTGAAVLTVPAGGKVTVLTSAA